MAKNLLDLASDLSCLQSKLLSAISRVNRPMQELRRASGNLQESRKSYGIARREI